MDSSTLLDSLRDLANNRAVTPAQVSNIIKPDYKKMTDFGELPDYASYQLMQSVFEKESNFVNYYFLPRFDTMSAEIQTEAGKKVLFSGYNYVGLGDDPRVIKAAVAATRQFGTHAGAARMVGGEIEIHAELEESLAEFSGHEAAVVGVGGYSANVSVLSYVLGKRDLLIHDSYMHNSGVAGGVQSGAKRVSFPHNDLDALEQRLREHRDRHQRALILVEGAYSMDGDIPNLPRLLELKKQYGCWLMVDEAHSYGALGDSGRGLAEHWGCNPQDVDISMGTLSKSFGSCGGFIAGSKKLIELLKIYAPGLLLYSTGISPANTAAALAAVNILMCEPHRVIHLQNNSRMFCDMAKRRKLDIGIATGLAPIVPVMIGEDLKAVRLASKLFREGMIAHPIIYPVVPRNEARIRFFITTSHREEHFEKVLNILAKELQT